MVEAVVVAVLKLNGDVDVAVASKRENMKDGVVAASENSDGDNVVAAVPAPNPPNPPMPEVVVAAAPNVPRPPPNPAVPVSINIIFTWHRRRIDECIFPTS